jgi:hypothetical protein
MLKLPNYATKKTLRDKLLLAMQCQDFNLS